MFGRQAGSRVDTATSSSTHSALPCRGRQVQTSYGPTATNSLGLARVHVDHPQQASQSLSYCNTQPASGTHSALPSRGRQVDPTRDRQVTVPTHSALRESRWMDMNWMRYHLPSSGQNSSACRPCSAGVTSSAVSRRPVGSGCRPGVGAGQGAGWLWCERCEVRIGRRQPAHGRRRQCGGVGCGGPAGWAGRPATLHGVAVAADRPVQPTGHLVRRLVAGPHKRVWRLVGRQRGRLVGDGHLHCMAGAEETGWGGWRQAQRAWRAAMAAGAQRTGGCGHGQHTPRARGRPASTHRAH